MESILAKILPSKISLSPIAGGDCIYIGQTKIAPEHYSENVLIENVICKDGRRQGLSLTAGKDITIKDCTFEGTGTIKYTAPGAGVDIEPNIMNAVVQNVTLENCKFLNNTNKPGDLRFFRINENCNVNVINCDFKDWVTFMKPSYNITFRNCTIPKIEPGKCDMSYIKFIDCQLGE
ncbi:MAG: right-handed parallel beta-helix repeat-containing protein [Bacteroidales bacterium]|nr:right-handed parallel beta-helix repeat-containing protein [Bacteroidales bacterium]